MDNPVRKVTVRDLSKKKAAKEKIVTITAYDAIMGRLADEAGCDLILVGDSMGNTVLGYDTTLPVTVDELIPLTRAVASAIRTAERAVTAGALERTKEALAALASGAGDPN